MNVKEPQKQKRLILVLTGLVVGWMVYVNLRPTQKERASRSEDSPTESSSAVPGEAEAALLKYSLTTEEIRTFAVDQEITVELKPSEAPTTFSRIHLRAQLDEQLVSVAAPDLLYRYDFHDVQFESTHADGQSAMPAEEVNGVIQSLTTSPLILKTNANRTAASWSVPRQTKLETFNLMRSVVLSGSLPLPANNEIKEWTGSEEDSTGLLSLSHKLISYVEGKATIEKEPLTVRVSSELPTIVQSPQSSQHAVVILPSSITKIEFDGRAGHLLKSDQRWSLRAQAAGLLATTHVRTQIDFLSKRAANEQNKQRTGSSADPSAQDGGFVSEHELQTAHSHSLKRKVAAQKVGHENWLSLRRQLTSSDFHRDGAARARFFEQLSALLYLQPELSTTVAHEIASLNPEDPNYMSQLALLSGVFSMQESPEAEAALAALAERLKDSPKALQQVIPALAAHRKPSERARDALLHYYTQTTDDEIRSTATLALGTFASHARNGRPDLTRETVERLKDDFDRTSSTRKRATLSGALGNVGASEALESARTLFTSAQDVSVKRSALYDLRFISDPAADAFLERIVLDSATEPELVVQGIRVMRMRPPLKTHLQSSTALFRSPTAQATVRSEALYTIAYLFPVAPEDVQKLLEEASADKNTQIAQQAKQLLARRLQ